MGISGRTQWKHFDSRLGICITLWLLSVCAAEAQHEKDGLYAVKFDRSCRQACRNSVLRSYGLSSRDLYPLRRHSFLLWLRATTANKLEIAEKVSSVAPFSARVESAQGSSSIHDRELRNACDMGTRSVGENEEVILRVGTTLMYNPNHGASSDVVQKALRGPGGILHAGTPLADKTEIIQESARLLTLKIGKSVTRSTCILLAELRNMDGVAYVEFGHNTYTSNNHAAAVGQSGSSNVINAQNAVIWQQGIMGQGEVVGVGDSGVDVDSCYFRESSQRNTSTEQIEWTEADWVNSCDLTRHKIVCYFIGKKSHFGDNASNAVGGHGTHTAGTIAGLHTNVLVEAENWNVGFDNVINKNEFANGMAPLAKLAITDIDGDEVGSLIPPIDAASDSYFVDPYEKAGVRIHSNSWGCSKPNNRARECNKYDTQTRSIDEFMWRNKDFLVFVAAGNSGMLSVWDTTSYGNGFYTVGAPATNKNGVSVGATMRYNRIEYECIIETKECDVDDLYRDSSRGPTFDGRTKPDLVFVGDKVDSARSSGNPLDFSEGDVCDGASLLLGVDTKSGTSMACPGVAGLASLVRQYYREVNPITGIKHGNRGNSGPLSDGFGPSAALIKATLINSGRSLKGYYQYRDGITGVLESVLVLNTTNPRHVEGFGRPQLSNVLVFAETRYDLVNPGQVASGNSTNSTQAGTTASLPLSLLPYDRQALGDGDTGHNYTIRVSAGGTFKATLVYTDPPGPLTEAFDTSPVLVNDLDLEVKCLDESGETGCPQFLKSGARDETLWSSTSRVENVEQVPASTNDEFKFEEAATLQVKVSAHVIDVNIQPYALVISGRGLSVDPTRSTIANWNPDWTLRASTPKRDSVWKKRALLGGIAAALFMCLALVAGISWGVTRRMRQNREIAADAA